VTAYVKENRSLRVHMAHLRRKLESDPARPRHQQNEPGMGYRFSA
jgi:two-component system KDP operon response regulator KdpE